MLSEIVASSDDARAPFRATPVRAYRNIRPAQPLRSVTARFGLCPQEYRPPGAQGVTMSCDQSNAPSGRLSSGGLRSPGNGRLRRGYDTASYRQWHPNGDYRAGD